MALVIQQPTPAGNIATDFELLDSHNFTGSLPKICGSTRERMKIRQGYPAARQLVEQVACAGLASHPACGSEPGGCAMKRPKEASRSLRQAVPARAGRDGRAGCRHAGEIMRGGTGQRGMCGYLSLVWRFFIFNFLNPRFIRANSIITETKPHNSFHPGRGSQHQQHSRLEQETMRGVVESLPDGVAMNRELLQWWWWTGGGCVPPGPGSVTPARCNEALRCELQRSLEDGKLPRGREIQGSKHFPCRKKKFQE